VARVARRDAQLRSEAPGAARRASASDALVRLQRAAGNRAVGRVLARAPAASIAVHRGSKLTAKEFVNALKSNQKVPGWLKNRVRAKGDAIVLASDLQPPSDKIWLFDESFAKAFTAGDWQITTAKATITVTKDKDDKLSWQQVVTPDLAAGEQLGHYMKTGPGRVEFSGDPPLDSRLGEVIYGWTVPKSATPLSQDKLNLVVIVTEIEVTDPAGARRTFKPSPDSIAEAIIHEIGVHAGRIAQGLPDYHDGSTVIQEISDQIGGFFRPATDTGPLELGATSKDILKFVSRRGS
jgi:hypothetical protein